MFTNILQDATHNVVARVNDTTPTDQGFRIADMAATPLSRLEVWETGFWQGFDDDNSGRPEQMTTRFRALETARTPVNDTPTDRPSNNMQVHWSLGEALDRWSDRGALVRNGRERPFADTDGNRDLELGDDVFDVRRDNDVGRPLDPLTGQNEHRISDDRVANAIIRTMVTEPQQKAVRISSGWASMSTRWSRRSGWTSAGRSPVDTARSTRRPV